MIAVIAGMVLFLFRIQLPSVVLDTCSSMGDMLGPLSMFVTGMLIGNINLRKMFTYKRVPLVLFLRLILFPLIMVALLKYGGLKQMAADGYQILFVTLLASVTPTASTVTQLAQIYGGDAEYAGILNAVTTLLCIATMPVMVWLY